MPDLSFDDIPKKSATTDLSFDDIPKKSATTDLSFDDIPKRPAGDVGRTSPAAGATGAATFSAPVAPTIEPWQRGEKATPQATLRPYELSWPEKVGAHTQDQMEYLGMTRGKAQELGQKATGIWDTVRRSLPGTGHYLYATEGAEHLNRGEYGKAAMDAAQFAMLGLPMPKGVGVAATRQLAQTGRAAELTGAAANAPRLTPAQGLARQAPFVADRVTADVMGSARASAATHAAEDADKNVVAKIVQDIFAPTTKGPAAERAAGIGREVTGLTAREHAVARQEFENMHGRVNALPPAALDDLWRYMEGRSQGAQLADPALQDVADAVRKANLAERKHLEDLPPALVPRFIEDYVAHQVKNPQQVIQNLKSGGRFPSSGFTKKRSMPTRADLIAAGGELITDNPLVGTLASLSNSQAWRAQKEFFTLGRATGDVLMLSPSKMPPGFTQLNRGFETRGAGKLVPAAPDGWAKIYNNMYSPGHYGWGDNASQLYDHVQEANNLLTQATLGLSGFHLFTEAFESTASRIGQAAGELYAAHPGLAAKSFAKGLAAPLDPLVPARLGGRGAKVIDQYTKAANHGPAYEEIVDNLTRGGARLAPTKRDLVLSASGVTGSPNLFTSLKRGDLGRDIKEGVKSTARAWADKPMKQSIKTAAGAAIGGVTAGPTGAMLGAFLGGGGLRAAGRVLETVASPIFEFYVPRLKAASSFDKMQSWMQLNPTATKAEQVAMARRIGDASDNRFGEMVRDHLFWNNTTNDIARVLMLSPTWNIGTARLFGGAVRDIASQANAVAEGHGLSEYLESGAKLKGASLNQEYVTGFLISSLAASAIYEYMMTGKWPQEVSFNPKTGGTVPGDKYKPDMPERAQLPGYGKDVQAAAKTVKELIHGDPNALWQELAGKQSPILSVASTLATGKDWAGRPISDPKEGLSGYMQGAGKTVGEHMVPIPFKQEHRQGSAIPTWQAVMGIRPKTSGAVSSSASEHAREAAWEAKLRTDANALRRQGKTKEADELIKEARKRRLEEKRAGMQRKQSMGGPQ